MSLTRLLTAVRQLGQADRRVPAATAGSSMRAGLARAAARGLRVASVIDVGASDGRWTRAALESFPAAAYLLLEAQSLHESALRRLRRAHFNTDYELSVAGPRDGSIHFDASDPFGGAAGEQPAGATDVLLPMRSIDSLVAERGLKPPFLIKLDTHGFETAILDGATTTLTQTALLIVETYNFKLNPADPHCLRFHEFCAWIEQRGMRCIDMCDVSRRPADQVLWQMDMFFAPSSDASFALREYA